MSLVRQIGLSILILLVLGGGGYWFVGGSADIGDTTSMTGQKRPPPLVDIAPAEMTVLSRTVEAVGTTRARQSVDISPAASGRVLSISFTPGSQVEKGSTLLQLDDVAERADVAEAEAERRKAALALDRARALVAKKSIPQSTVDELEATFVAADARVDRAKKQLAERRIDAPFTGRVGLKQVDVGARVDNETVITTLDDLAAVEVEFGVPEIFFSEVSAGQKVTATSAAFGARVFEGVIQTVDSRIDRVSRSFQVRATIPNDDLALPTGMFMLVEVTLFERKAVTVPEEAVVVSGDRAELFVIEDGKAVKREVMLGQRELGLVEIVDGVMVGERIVVGGIQKVRPGVEVRIVGEDTDETDTPAAPDVDASPAAAKPSA
ncbi:MAG: efflux RND transporter periplasmic adaptor subunit [Geminicoccaceae bacterium]